MFVEPNKQMKEKLINLALNARMKAYAPYSQYCVGAAALMESGNIYIGCNVENASYPCGICAERNAIFNAVANGDKKLVAIAIVGGPAKGELTYAFPCGLCRQVMREFAVDEKKMLIIVGTGVYDYKTYTLSSLLPESFGPDQLV